MCDDSILVREKCEVEFRVASFACGSDRDDFWRPLLRTRPASLSSPTQHLGGLSFPFSPPSFITFGLPLSSLALRVSSRPGLKECDFLRSGETGHFPRAQSELETSFELRSLVLDHSPRTWAVRTVGLILR